MVGTSNNNKILHIKNNLIINAVLSAHGEKRDIMKTINLGTKNNVSVYAADNGDSLTLLNKNDLMFCSPDFLIKFDSGVYPSVNDIDVHMCNEAFDTLNR